MKRKIPINNDHLVDAEAVEITPPTIDTEANDGSAPSAGWEGSKADSPEDPSQEDISTLRKQIQAAEQRAEESHNQYLRTLADFQNFRRRMEEQSQEQRQFANRELILNLLPVVDNFERALSAAETNRSYESLVGGVALTLRQLQDFLKKNGVEPIEAVGKEFDPNLHEAVMRVPESEYPENTVVDEMQRGYTMHSRVLRPSMVKVA